MPLQGFLNGLAANPFALCFNKRLQKVQDKGEKKMIKQALIIANGDVEPQMIDRIDLTAVDRIVAADGGAVRALACGLTPDVVIGDFDSLPPDFSAHHEEIQFMPRPSQELNDLEKALIFCREQGVEKVALVGITGDRVDHTMNNFSVLAKFVDEFEFEIYSPQGRIFLVRKELRFAAQKGQTVSLIPLGRVKGVKTAGLQYPLHNEALALGEREGASNSAVDGPFSVSVESGTLLVFVNDGD